MHYSRSTLLRRLCNFLVLGVACLPGLAAAVQTAALEARVCGAIAARVDAVSGDVPLFLRSYDSARGAGEPDVPALRTAAFVYDNALAVVALVGCDKSAQALRVGEALRLAAMSDARLRNVYRAGLVGAKALPNGWWDARQNRWIEDAYQQGSATGNVAWTGLAMLSLYDVTKEKRWSDAAGRLADWIIANTKSDNDVGGYSGGIEGFDANPRTIGWKSTEHNIDVFALCAALARIAEAETQPHWQKCASTAWKFIGTQWDATSGHFFVGTLLDGRTPNRAMSGLDVQLWAQLLPGAKPEWQRAISYIEREHAVTGGFDFNADRDGLWLEGTAQAALVYRTIGRHVDADRLFATIAGQVSEGGFVYATREPRVTTGLAVSGDSKSADFFYYRLPHLGATAWIALAATKRNPFILPAPSTTPLR